MDDSVKNKKIFLFVMALVVVLIAVFYLYSRSNNTLTSSDDIQQDVDSVSDDGVSVIEEEKDTSLGGEIFQKANNPVQDELPDAIAPSVNPLGEVYNNPFN